MRTEKPLGDVTSCIDGLSVYLTWDSWKTLCVSVFTHRSTAALLWYVSCHSQCFEWVLVWQYKVLLSVSSKFSGDVKPYFYFFSCHGYIQQGRWLEATLNSVLSSLWQICLQTEEDLQYESHTHTLVLTGGWQQNRDQCNLLQHNPKSLSSSICLSQWNSPNVWNHFCIQLRSSQPQQSGSRRDPESFCMLLSGRLSCFIARFPLKQQNEKLDNSYLSVQTP